jgi:choline trimethylamine-lyase
VRLFYLLDPEQVSEKARLLFNEERQTKKILNGWFLSRELAADATEGRDLNLEDKAATELEAVIRALPLEISDHAIFAGTQRDAFAASYALINPAFEVETFRGYCDPLEVYDYATPSRDVTAERIATMRSRASRSAYVRALTQVYTDYAEYTGEVAFFVEQVTGHLVPDFRGALKYGIRSSMDAIDRKLSGEDLPDKKRLSLKAMQKALQCAITLAHRYADIAEQAMDTASESRIKELQLISDTLRRVPEFGARTLREAMQSYLLLWQVMCLEQAPNPFAFSVGNADRIFFPYMQADGASRQETAALFKHLLVFFNVGERSWAISQNVLVSGRDIQGNDLTNDMSYAILDAYYEMNLPQPILSVKLHQHTPGAFYRELGRFFFTPGCLTPSIFNDDSLFQTLNENGIDECDLADYAVAGCQEPVIMGKDTANTTNSWLNLAKVLELTLSGGSSTITGNKIGPQSNEAPLSLLQNVRLRFYANLDVFSVEMANAANGVSRALSNLRVPFLSSFMGCIDTAVDCRDTEQQGTKYNGSGCLIHGLSVVADSFVAIDCLLKDRPQDAENLIHALQCNFEGFDELREYLHACPKFGNNDPVADNEAVKVAGRVSDLVRSLKNYLGNPFRPDWSSPSTHLLYGYWVGATPDGRVAREMLGYGIDPLYGDACNGLGFRTLSTLKLPFDKFNGGVASHFGVDPKYFTASSFEEKGQQFYERVIHPLFFNPSNTARAPFYLYVNVTTAETLLKVLANPKKYAPSGVYILRIHGTFVNFLDLSPAIQQDIIKRLDPASTYG